MIATTALQYDWNLNHLDIEQAFVQSRTDREIFMGLLEGWRRMCEVMRPKQAL